MQPTQKRRSPSRWTGFGGMAGGLGRNRTTDTRIFKTNHARSRGVRVCPDASPSRRNVTSFPSGVGRRRLLAPALPGALNQALNFPGSVGLSPCGMSNGINGIAGVRSNRRRWTRMAARRGVAGGGVASARRGGGMGRPCRLGLGWVDQHRRPVKRPCFGLGRSEPAAASIVSWLSTAPSEYRHPTQTGRRRSRSAAGSSRSSLRKIRCESVGMPCPGLPS